MGFKIRFQSSVYNLVLKVYVTFLLATKSDPFIPLQSDGKHEDAGPWNKSFKNIV